MPGGAHVWQRDVFLDLGRSLALQFCPRFPLLESGIATPATEIQILQRSQAGVHTLAVFGQSLAHLRDEAAACSLGQFSEEFPGLDDTGLPTLGLVVEDGSRLGSLMDEAGRAPHTVRLGLVRCLAWPCPLPRGTVAGCAGWTAAAPRR